MPLLECHVMFVLFYDSLMGENPIGLRPIGGASESPVGLPDVHLFGCGDNVSAEVPVTLFVLCELNSGFSLGNTVGTGHMLVCFRNKSIRRLFALSLGVSGVRNKHLFENEHVLTGAAAAVRGESKNETTDL
jgi:hypothetical protein